MEGTIWPNFVVYAVHVVHKYLECCGCLVWVESASSRAHLMWVIKTSSYGKVAGRAG